MTANLLHFDGFDHYDTNQEFAEKTGFASATIAPASGGRSTGQRLHMTNTLQGGKKTVPAQTQLGAGIAMKVNGSIPSAIPVIVIKSGSGLRVQLQYETGGTLRLVDPFSTSLWSGAAPATGSWHYYELQVTQFDETSGDLVLKVDSNIVATLTNVRTSPSGGGSTADSVSLGLGGNDSADVDFDDWVIADDFVGDVGCRWCPVTADGSTTDFVPLSSTNKSNVDDAFPDDDTSYNASANPGDKDLFTLDGAALPGSGLVVGVQYIVWAKKDDVGTRGWKPTMRQSATNHDGTGDNLGMSYTFHKEISQINPQTSAAYVLSEITTSEFGYKAT